MNAVMVSFSCPKTMHALKGHEDIWIKTKPYHESSSKLSQLSGIVGFCIAICNYQSVILSFSRNCLGFFAGKSSVGGEMLSAEDLSYHEASCGYFGS